MGCMRGRVRERVGVSSFLGGLNIGSAQTGKLIKVKVQVFPWSKIHPSLITKINLITIVIFLAEQRGPIEELQ